MLQLLRLLLQLLFYTPDNVLVHKISYIFRIMGYAILAPLVLMGALVSVHTWSPRMCGMYTSTLGYHFLSHRTHPRRTLRFKKNC